MAQEETKQYRATRSVIVNGEVVTAGAVVDLYPDHAAPLIAAGQLEPFVVPAADHDPPAGSD